MVERKAKLDEERYHQAPQICCNAVALRPQPLILFLGLSSLDSAAVLMLNHFDSRW